MPIILLFVLCLRRVRRPSGQVVASYEVFAVYSDVVTDIILNSRLSDRPTPYVVNRRAGWSFEHRTHACIMHNMYI